MPSRELLGADTGTGVGVLASARTVKGDSGCLLIVRGAKRRELYTILVPDETHY